MGGDKGQRGPRINSCWQSRDSGGGKRAPKMKGEMGEKKGLNR